MVGTTKGQSVRKAVDVALGRVLMFMPVVIFAMGCVADLVLNSAVTNPHVAKILPEICGLTVGALTVLTFAKRRHSYLVAAAVFTFTEMIAIALPLPIIVRAFVCCALVATAAACMAVYVRGPWAVLRAVPVEERADRS
jgi:hypothetical protein